MKKIISNYYGFFDNKLSDTSLVVWIIWLLIFIIGSLAPAKSYSSINYKSNILEFSYNKENKDYIFLNWEKYFLIKEDIKNNNKEEVIDMKKTLKY